MEEEFREEKETLGKGTYAGEASFLSVIHRKYILWVRMLKGTVSLQYQFHVSILALTWAVCPSFF